MPNKNVAVADDLLNEMRTEALSEGKTPDEMFEEAGRRLLATRRLREFVAENIRLGLQRGYSEEDVPRLISEVRQERRER
jgi:hypothetical protein